MTANPDTFKVGDVVLFWNSDLYKGTARIYSIEYGMVTGVRLDSSYQKDWSWFLSGAGYLVHATEIAKALYE